jgi:mRNA interferase RelE/StbE
MIEFVRLAAKIYNCLQSADELYRVRIGDLRLLFSVEDQILLVLIVKIGHRGSVYRD